MQNLRVPYFKQDTDYTCGPASLQMVFAHYGIRESEKELTKELKTNPEHGTPHQEMIDGALRRGLHAYVNDHATLGEIQYFLGMGIPVIVHFIEIAAQEDHYSVVIGITDTHVVLNDPWNGEGLRLSHEVFLQRWTCGTEGNCSRWLMALSEGPFAIGRQYHPHGA